MKVSTRKRVIDQLVLPLETVTPGGLLLPATSVESDQRYTPELYFPAIERVFDGPIGLDPTADPSRRVPALHHLREADDCLQTDWTPFLVDRPFVFMNPPFSNSLPFLRRMCEYLESGVLKAAITLTLAGVLANKRTQPLLQTHCAQTCSPHGRINFVGSGKQNDRDVIWGLWLSSTNPDFTIERCCVQARFGREFTGLHQRPVPSREMIG